MSIPDYYAIGETVVDLLVKSGKPLSMKAGGAMLNTCISLGRLGIPAHFMGEFSTDKTGVFIEEFLTANNVSTEFTYRYNNGKTTLALAFLNEHNDAIYDFYKILPKKRLAINWPEFKENDVLHFGSIYSFDPAIRKQYATLLEKASKANAILVYDPNFRAPHKDSLPKIKLLIDENFRYANIVKGSDEDFELLFGLKTAEQVWGRMPENVTILIYTAAEKGATILFKDQVMCFSAKKLQVLSTVGAGDSFSAGFLFQMLKLLKNNRNIASFTNKEWAGAVEAGIQCASLVCQKLDNYISLKEATLLKQDWKDELFSCL